MGLEVGIEPTSLPYQGNTLAIVLFEPEEIGSPWWNRTTIVGVKVRCIAIMLKDQMAGN
jgi:hypothetical protein